MEIKRSLEHLKALQQEAQDIGSQPWPKVAKYYLDSPTYALYVSLASLFSLEAWSMGSRGKCSLGVLPREGLVGPAASHIAYAEVSASCMSVLL